MATDGPTPDPCSPLIYQYGDVVSVWQTFGACHFEGLIRQVAKETGRLVDWHFVGGRAVVKAMPDDVEVIREAVERIVRPEMEKRREEHCRELGI